MPTPVCSAIRARCSGVSATRVSVPVAPGANRASSARAICESSAQRACSSSAISFCRCGSFSSAIRVANPAASACFSSSSARSAMGSILQEPRCRPRGTAGLSRRNARNALGMALPCASPGARHFLPKRHCFRHCGMAGELLFRFRGGGRGMALRLRYQIDSPRRLREHVHLVDGAGYFFFPEAIAPKGTLASLEIDFSSTAQVALLRGWVWARATGGGLWLELAAAQRCLEKLERVPERSELRLSSDQLVLAEPEGLPALLCRLRDVSAGGARLAAMPSDAGAPGQRIRVKLPEAGISGEQLLAQG